MLALRQLCLHLQLAPPMLLMSPQAKGRERARAKTTMLPQCSLHLLPRLLLLAPLLLPLLALPMPPTLPQAKAKEKTPVLLFLPLLLPLAPARLFLCLKPALETLLRLR